MQGFLVDLAHCSYVYFLGANYVREIKSFYIGIIFGVFFQDVAPLEKITYLLKIDGWKMKFPVEMVPERTC